MKQHTTNYTNALIEVAEDCPAATGQTPPEKEPKTAAQIQYEMLINAPYQFTSDDVVYESDGKRKGISREDFFSKGQPCLRSSALGKRYGWGIHSDDAGKVAIYAVDSDDYQQLAADKTVQHIKAMRSSKK